MKFNISKDNATFYVNPEKRKVVCIIDHTKRMFIDFIEQNLPIQIDCTGIWGDNNKFFNKLRMPNRFVGVATCGPDDDWDEEIGKLIAFSRAKNNLNRSFFKRANTYINTIDNWLNQSVEIINAYGDKVSINTERRHNKITEILED